MSGSDNANELFNRIREENRKRHAQLMDEAKHKADAIGKEPFNLAKLEEFCDTSREGRLAPEDERRREYEDLYYIGNPKLMTMKELAEYITYLRQWK